MIQYADYPTELGGEELNRGKGSVVDSNFLCSEYDDRVDQETNETDSWEWDHSCNTGNVTKMGNTWGRWTLLILMGSKEDKL